jgi:hypothetical protein
MLRLIPVLVGCLLGASAVPLWCQEFRIETQVYLKNRAKPISENLTLFSESMVYDFLFDADVHSKIAEIVILDLSKNRFVLLDPQRELKLEIDEADLGQLVSALKTSEAWREKYPFLLDPKFTTQYDESAERLELNSKYVTYAAKLEAPLKSNAFPAFGQYLDASARLNATDPQKLPPFARLELNREIKARRMIPMEVEMEMDLPNDGLGTWNISITSKHSVIWQLSKTDHERIEAANRDWTQFRTAKLAEYRNLPAPTAVSR